MGDTLEDDKELNKEIDRMEASMLTPKRWPPLVHRINGVNVMDLVGVGSHPDLPAHRKVWLLVLLLVVKDGATAIRFEPWRFEAEESSNRVEELGFRMLYEVNGQEHDLVPPPHWLKAHLAREIEAVADLSRPRRRIADLLRRLASWIDGEGKMPRQGSFRIKLHEILIDVEVLAYASEIGERYYLRLAHRSDTATKIATEELRRLTEKW